MPRSRRAAAIATVAMLAAAPVARAYDFSIETRIIAQAYDLRSIRLIGPDLELGRRRYTQTLALDLIDLGDLAAGRRKTHKHFGPTISFSSYLRVDHDFGDWTQGLVLTGGRFIDATDAVPELRASSLDLDLLYAYLDVRGLVDGAVDVRIGRQLKVDALDWFAMDGVTARVATPFHVAIEAFGGARVRDASPLGSYQVELDGTSGADCREYVENLQYDPQHGTYEHVLGLGHGTWTIIDRTQGLSDHPRFDDTGYCPQRDALMPTYGAAIETNDVHGLYARVVYRRSESRTVGLLGDPTRLQTPCDPADPSAGTCGTDLGLYPNEFQPVPKWGVDEERVAATVRANIDWDDGRAQASPWVAARYSLLNGLVDMAELGVRLRYREHALEPEVDYYVPTFDGDSIFNVFAIEPSTETRLAYSWSPRDGRLRASASVWLRAFQHDDEGKNVEAGGKVDQPLTSDTAAGFTASGEALIGERWLARVDAYSDNGYGGLRSGGDAGVRWHKNRVTATARGSLVYVATDQIPRLQALTGALQVGGGWQLADGVAVHGVLEEAYDAYLRSDLRALAVLDLAFAPEM
jgi:hypothetical protein